MHYNEDHYNEVDILFSSNDYDILLVLKHSLFCNPKKDSQQEYVVVYVSFVSSQ